EVARGLLSDDGALVGCTVSLASSSDATAAKDEWRGTWRDMKLVSEGKDNVIIRTAKEQDQPLGVAAVNQRIELQLIKNVNANDLTTFTNSIGNWAPLWLLHKYQGQREKPNGKIWHVEFPVGAPGANGLLRLKLEFDRGLPELDNWPKR